MSASNSPVAPDGNGSKILWWIITSLTALCFAGFGHFVGSLTHGERISALEARFDVELRDIHSDLQVIRQDIRSKSK